MAEVSLAWNPYDHQVEALKAFDEGKRRQSLIWHRRAGKDFFCLRHACNQAHQRIGNYWHLFPLHVQARKAIWEGIDEEGKPLIDSAFPPELVERKSAQEMFIKLKCGSTWQMAGSDKYNALVGSNPVGVTMSEWALCNPNAWDYIRPILRKNKGWAIFITTYRGRNHAYKMHERVKHLPDWYASLKTVDDTHKHDGLPLLTPEDIQAERDEGMDEEMIQQEYYCSPDAAIRGAFYGKLMRNMRQEGRIGKVPYDPRIPVWTSWDLGMNNLMVICFWQMWGPETRLIDHSAYYYTGYEAIVRDLREKPYVYGGHVLPHDKKVTEQGTGLQRDEVLHQLGIQTMQAPGHHRSDGIEAVKNLLPVVWIDEEKNERLIEALEQYRQDYNEERDVFSINPLHDWTSDYADAVRYFAVSRHMLDNTGNDPDYSWLDRQTNNW